MQQVTTIHVSYVNHNAEQYIICLFINNEKSVDRIVPTLFSLFNILAEYCYLFDIISAGSYDR